MTDEIPRRLTRSVQKKITADWLNELPGLGIYKPRSLMRRVGPMLVGICLDRGSGGDTYYPCFHVHFLGTERPRESPVLRLWTQVRAKSGGPTFVKVRWHAETYMDVLKRMISQSLLPLEGPVTLDQVIGAYRKYQRMPDGRLGQANDSVDLIMLLSLYGRQNEARKELERILRLPDPDRGFRSIGEVEKYEADMLHAIEHPEEIRARIEPQAEMLKVGKLPFEELIV